MEWLQFQDSHITIIKLICLGISIEILDFKYIRFIKYDFQRILFLEVHGFSAISFAMHHNQFAMHHH